MSNRMLSMRSRGMGLLRAGSFESGIEALNEALKEDPHDPDLYIAIGFAHAQQGDMEGAIAVLERGIDAAPESARLHYNLGVAYHRVNRLTHAKDEYLRSLGLDPTYVAAKHALDLLTKARPVTPLDEGSDL